MRVVIRTRLVTFYGGGNAKNDEGQTRAGSATIQDGHLGHSDETLGSLLNEGARAGKAASVSTNRALSVGGQVGRVSEVTHKQEKTHRLVSDKSTVLSNEPRDVRLTRRWRRRC
jgi:hypothetical protein